MGIKKSFSDKRLRYGSLSTVMIIAAVGLFVLVNLVVSQLNISFDLTADQRFSLSTGSINILRDLDQEVRIYSLWPTGQENFLFQQLLSEYESHSNLVTVINRDPTLHPGFVEQFAQPDEPIANGSIVVVGPGRHRVVHAGDLVTSQFNMQTWSNEVVSFNIEPQVTNAIRFVTAEDTPVIYRVVGNNEFPLPPALVQEIEMAGYEIREVDLLLDEVPEGAEMLLITMPERDWPSDQAQRISDFLQNDGRALLMLGYRGTRFPNMDEVLAGFGIRLGDYIVIEGSPGHFLMNNPLFLLPEFARSDITDGLIERNFRPFLEHSTGIDTLELRRPGTRIEPLIHTSTHAYGRIDPEILGVTRAPQDIGGPFNLAVSVEDSFFIPALNQSLTSRMVIVSSEAMFSEMHNNALGGANWSFLINSLNWLRDQPVPVFIPSQAPPATMPLIMTQAQMSMIALFAMVALPLGFGIAGLVVWLRRRNA